MRSLLLFFTFAGLFFVVNVSAQTTTCQPPVSASENFIAVKSLGLPTLFLLQGAVGSAGIEYSFCKRHSFGFSLAYFEVGEKFSDNDSIQKVKNYPYKYDVERGLFLYYRYYSKDWWQLWQGFFRPYIGSFGRLGNADLHFDKQFETDQVKYEEWQVSCGALFGAVWTIDAGRICLDAHIGQFYKWKVVRDEHMVAGTAVVENRKEQGPGIKLGMTLTCFIRRGR